EKEYSLDGIVRNFISSKQNKPKKRKTFKWHLLKYDVHDQSKSIKPIDKYEFDLPLKIDQSSFYITNDHFVVYPSGSSKKEVNVFSLKEQKIFTEESPQIFNHCVVCYDHINNILWSNLFSSVIVSWMT